MTDQWLAAGEIDEARRRVEEQIRKEPAVSRHRIYYFQLLVILGQWERALNQLKVLEELDAETIPMVVTYREAIRCELLRARIFAGTHSPVIFGEPAEWTARLVEALRLTATGEAAHGAELRAEAFEAAPATPGSLDGQAFQWIADADTRLGPVIEVVLNGRYAWVPYDRIAAIAIEPPGDLRDSVWMPAHFTWANGGETVGLIPTRYPGSEASEDTALQLARKTLWEDAGAETFVGLGQRLLTTDQEDHALMDIREIRLGGAAADGLQG